MTITAKTENGESFRITLPPAVWTGHQEISTGYFREAIYIGPKSKRVVEEIDNRWENRLTHCAHGTQYRLVTDADHLADLAAEYEEVATALESTGILVPAEL